MKSSSEDPQPELFRTGTGLDGNAKTSESLIDRAGVRGFSYPIQVLDHQNQVQHTIADVELYVGPSRDFETSHRNQLVEILNSRRGELTIRNLPEFLGEIQRRLESANAFIHLTFPYFLEKRAPVSGSESLMEYRCGFHASKKGELVEFALEVQIPVASRSATAGNQRCLISAEIRSNEFIWIEEVIGLVEACGSVSLFPALKPEDERFIAKSSRTKHGYVEELGRDVVNSLSSLPGVEALKISIENLEAMGNHSGYAELHWPPPRLNLQQSLGLPEPQGQPVKNHGGNWLKKERIARQLSQQEVASQLGISTGHLSRVESGEKGLSRGTAIRLASALGMDPEATQLRCGHLPDRMKLAIETNAESFLRWSSNYLTDHSDRTE